MEHQNVGKKIGFLRESNEYGRRTADDKPIGSSMWAQFPLKPSGHTG